MRRASLVVMLGGCMRIYPDPELPDLEIEWYSGDCREGTGDVELVLTSPDTDLGPTARVPCTDERVAFPDVPRVRFTIAGTLFARDGGVFTTSGGEVDLRDGFDETVGLYFGGFDNFRVRWEFAGGATCGSVGADYIEIQAFGIGVPCALYEWAASAPPGMHSVVLLAQTAEGAIVARSLATDVTIDAATLTDLGTFVLAP